ncbi:MAG: hypothetical protein M1837_002489 [Sclerophora amabilis]|nr:MAG: hypothetical protein M1837_002489 [Sclerophora amabilis]
MVKGHLTGSTLRGSIAGTCGIAFLVRTSFPPGVESHADQVKLFGYDQGVLGGVISLPSFRREFNDPDENTEGIFAAIYDIGCLIGALVAFVTAERFGRKGSIMWGSIIMILGTILQTSATESVQMILSRVITGIGNGINTCAVPTWQAESFKSHNRGALLVIQSALIALGNPLSTWLSFATSRAEPSSFAWRFPIAFQGFFVIAILIMLPFLPESPRWLVAHGRVDEATDVLARLEGPHATRTDANVVAERDMIVESVDKEREIGQATWTEVFTEGKLRNLSRVLLGAGPYMFNQWSGINCLAYFLPITFERNIGLSPDTSLIISGVLGIQYFFASMLPYFFIERAGRRTVMMLSSAGCSFCMIIISVMLYINTKTSNWVFVAFCFLFFDVFSWGILPVSWMYASEIMPLRTRNKGVALGVASHWLSNFIVVYVTPQAIRTLGFRLYIIWAVLCASFVPITYLFYPETARRSLEEVDAIFARESFGITHTRKPGPKRRSSVNPERLASMISLSEDEPFLGGKPSSPNL